MDDLCVKPATILPSNLAALTSTIWAWEKATSLLVVLRSSLGMSRIAIIQAAAIKKFIQIVLLNLPESLPKLGAQMHLEQTENPVRCQYRGHPDPVKYSGYHFELGAVTVAAQELPARGRSERSTLWEEKKVKRL